MPIDLTTLPLGAWLRREGDIIVIGTRLTESRLFNTLFALFWTISMVLFPLGIVWGDWFFSLFGIPFFLVGLWLWKSAIMSLFGHVEIRLDRESGTVFSGVGKLGRTQTFHYKETHTIDEYVFVIENDIPRYAIKIEGEGEV